MNRAIVMEIGKRHLIVMTPSGEFKQVPKQPGCTVGEEIELTVSPVRMKARSRRFAPYLAAAAAVVLLLLFLPRMFSLTPDSEVALYLTMDINPSLEIAVDSKETVLELRALNEDGAQLINDFSYVGMPIEQVAKLIMQRVYEGSYLDSGDADIIITTTLMSRKLEAEFERLLSEKVNQSVQETIAARLADQAASSEIKVTVLSAPEEIREEAALQGLSTGKMVVYLLAKEEGKDIPLETLQQDSIHHAAEAVGGLGQIVTQVESSTTMDNKEKLSQLLEQEKANRENSSNDDKGKAENVKNNKQTDKDQEKAKAAIEKEQRKQAEREEAAQRKAAKEEAARQKAEQKAREKALQEQAAKEKAALKEVEKQQEKKKKNELQNERKNEQKDSKSTVNESNKNKDAEREGKGKNKKEKEKNGNNNRNNAGKNDNNSHRGDQGNGRNEGRGSP